MFSIKWLIALYCSLYLKEKQNKSRCFCKRLAKVEISSTSVAANICLHCKNIWSTDPGI